MAVGGAGFGKTYYGEQTVRGNVLGKQTVGAITLLAPGDVSFRLYNDMFGQSGHDRWRTSAAELTIGDFSVGTYVTTNDGKKESGIHGYDPNIVDPYLGANPEESSMLMVEIKKLVVVGLTGKSIQHLFGLESSREAKSIDLG